MLFSRIGREAGRTPEPLNYETESLDACPLCGHRDLADWRQGWDRQHRLSSRRFPYARCRSCALYFLSTRPVAPDVGKFYPREYGPYHASAPEGSRRFRSWPVRLLRRKVRGINAELGRHLPDRAEERIEELYRPPSAGAALLDFGCGSARFLDRARTAGWRTVGVDFSEDVIAAVRARGHEAHLAATGSWREMPESSFDFARLYHVLEHLYEPLDVLSTLCAQMKPGALLHLGLPNPAGLSSRLFRTRWWGLECPRHVMLYTEERAGGILRDAGFRDPVVVRDAVTKDFVRSLGYLLQDLGAIGPRALLRLPGGALAEALRFPMRVTARLGLADRFHVFARKGGAR